MQHRLRILKLADEILDKRLSQYRHKCPENITDLFFLEIENDEKLLEEYRDLVISGKGDLSINQQLGKIVKEYWNLENLGRCTNPKSRLIESYEKHSN
jgi:hypothetical protein